MKNSIQNFQKLFSAFGHLRFFKLMKNNNLIFTQSISQSFFMVAALSLMVFTGCESDSDELLLEEESVNELHLSANDGIFDGANGGMEGFYFLPPMVKSPTYSGTFDAGLSPVVEICETLECVTFHASFSMNMGEDSELVRVDKENEHYIVNWHTDQTGTQVGQTYRIRISVAGTVLGHADIQMAANGQDAKNITDGEAIALVDGRTLPIKFRIEEGAVYVIGSEGGTFSSTDGLVTLEIPGGAIDEEIGITVEPATDPSMNEKMLPDRIFDFGPSGTQFSDPVVVTIKYDPATLPSGIDEQLLSIRKYLNGDWVNIEGSTVDIINNTVQASLNSFSIYGVGERGVYPELTGVDSYITRVSTTDSRYMVHFAIDGVPIGGGACCFESLEAALNAYPDRNHAYLPESTRDDIDEGVIPVLNGVDGYIYLRDQGGYLIRFAVDGVLNESAACCKLSLEEARNMYPERNFIFLPPSTEVNDLSWHSMGSGMNSQVLSLIVHDGDLIAGGVFTTAGGETANRIARWDGSVWQPMGSGMNSYEVWSLAVYNGDLIAGGFFSTAGGVTVNNIARWDGSAWQPLGSGLNSTVRSLVVHNGELIAGGHFSIANGETVNYIARWDGSAWHSMGSGMNHFVRSLVVHNGDLIAGGQFTIAGGETANRVARWDGSTWQPMGSGINANVSSLTVHNDDLIAGGQFTTAGGETANRVARWDGSAWYSMGSGMNSEVFSLIIHDGYLIAGGGFTTADGETAHRVARWDGSAWQPMSSGMNGTVATLTVYNGGLIAGGVFTTADGKTANRVAQWGTP